MERQIIYRDAHGGGGVGRQTVLPGLENQVTSPPSTEKKIEKPKVKTKKEKVQQALIPAELRQKILDREPIYRADID